MALADIKFNPEMDQLTGKDGKNSEPEVADADELPRWTLTQIVWFCLGSALIRVKELQQ